ncbi:bifunctional diaminohydroxyphosphoribosylaminopyrimidine deaminase/5-amino-6-(5-phosphoribosylamino)uracil reductase RibD [Pelagibacterales bacterium SAG-MED20]|nr:bifunctional diaminohydroxyphosphoribosylaminopyrimidine deaminase/5-amino-6-(5-phosphoribosylamino)uracil reductase RibD [Pelagibacterales bacterium SAG-MED20]
MSTRKDKFTKKDIQYMSLALNLARARHGLTGKNPSVGCVIVKHDKIISIGQTGYTGRPHAEYNAIKNAIENLKSSKMYISLEPCNHYGQTPPCTKEIIKKKISDVIYSIEDIDKKVKGKSYKILKSNNVNVKKGLLKKEITNFYKPYFFNRKNKLPFVTGKIAISKNNLIYSDGTKRITNVHSDKLTHFLRYKNDSILISYKTLNKDNPKLNCRLNGLKKFSTKRIILDNYLNTKTSSYIFNSANKKNTIIFYNKANKQRVILFKKKGIQLIRSNLTKKKYFDLKLVLKKLYKFGVRNILVEGGNDLTGSFLKKKLFNQFYLFKSRKILNKSVPFKDFNHLNYLIDNYRIKSKINKKLSKDTITFYKN